MPAPPVLRSVAASIRITRPGPTPARHARRRPTPPSTPAAPSHALTRPLSPSARPAPHPRPRPARPAPHPARAPQPRPGRRRATRRSRSGRGSAFLPLDPVCDCFAL